MTQDVVNLELQNVVSRLHDAETLLKCYDRRLCDLEIDLDEQDRRVTNLESAAAVLQAVQSSLNALCKDVREASYDYRSLKETVLTALDTIGGGC